MQAGKVTLLCSMERWQEHGYAVPCLADLPKPPTQAQSWCSGQHVHEALHIGSR